MSKVKSRNLPLLLVLLALASAVLLGYGFLQITVSQRWNRAEALRRQGKTEEARAQYQDLSRFLRRADWLKDHFRAEYAESLIVQLELLYNDRNYDQVVEMAEAGVQEEIADMPAAHFWSGNALFQKGLGKEEKENAFPWFHRALAQYKKALEEDVGRRWNIRYNYELLKDALERSTKEKKLEPVELLREKVKVQDDKAHKKVAG